MTSSSQEAQPSSRTGSAALGLLIIGLAAAALIGGVRYLYLKGSAYINRPSTPTPLLEKSHPVDWLFVFKFNAAAFPGCGEAVACPFGGSPGNSPSGQGLRFAYASSDNSTLAEGSGCAGNSVHDPLGATFDQIYNGNLHYVIWNDQLFGSPQVPDCSGAGCTAPWATSKGALAWNDAGDGLVLQASTPSWPASGSAKHPRQGDGNSLGCIKDNNAAASQHFFSLKLSRNDTLKVLQALANASVVTDPANPQLVSNGGPADIQSAVRQLGRKSSSTAFTDELLSTGVRLLSKPSNLYVPPWQFVSAKLDSAALTTATFWASPKIPATNATDPVTCWLPQLGRPGPVGIATTGVWNNKTFDLTGGSGNSYNHAKLGVSTSQSQHLAIFGDLNQQGILEPPPLVPSDSGPACAIAQNGRGGLFFILDDFGLSNSLKSLLQLPLSPPESKLHKLANWLIAHAALATSLTLSAILLAAFLLFLYIKVLTWPTPAEPTNIEEIFASDAPITASADDRLGALALVNRLSRFLQNRNTSPPLVISLQARWGMGKSSVMRMLQSTLENDKAAVTVWFNAWHHQKEDQLLAYLLETVQKEAVPPWFSAVGIWFRIDLLRIRLLADLDRLILVILSIAYFTLLIFRPDLFQFSRWFTGLGGVAAALPILQIVIPFKSNPEKLASQAGGGIVANLKELIRLPSLVGKSDVRQEFASNLNDVVRALNPQRLVIFLDDLDRCRPDQVVQILEAINFLSSVADCMVLVGADYEKVETLMAMEFEKIAVAEAANLGNATPDPVTVRVAYARNYLRKIVNLRLNLRLPVAKDIAVMLKKGPPPRPRERKGLKRLAVAAILAASVAAPLVLAKVLRPQASAAPKAQPALVVVPTQPPVHTPVTVERPDTPAPPVSAVPATPPPPPPSTVAETRAAKARDWLLRAVQVAALPLALIGLFLSYWLSRPKVSERPADDESFGIALEQRSEDIFKRCSSPREVRRFMNYLRLFATEPVETLKTGDLPLREKFPGRFDAQLVHMAALGYTTSQADIEPEIRDYFLRECDLFGLDPETFTPRETLGHEPVAPDRP